MKIRNILAVMVTGLILGGPNAHSFNSHAGGTALHPFGLGVEFGEPTGFTGKYWMDTNGAIDGGLSFSVNSFFLVYADYLYHFPSAFGHSTPFVSQLIPYIGIGGVLFISTDNARTSKFYYADNRDKVGLGVRVPLGIEWLPPTAPIGVFVQLIPGVGILPSSFGIFEGGLGIRYYF